MPRLRPTSRLTFRSGWMRLALRLGLGVCGAVSPALAGETLVRPGDDLQAALSSAAEGDTIRLAPGRYTGPLVLDRRVTLEGAPGAVVDDLRDSAWILREAGSGTRQAFVRLLEAAGLSLDAIDIELELPGNEAVIGAVENGLTATLVSRSVVAAPLQYGRLALAPVAPLPRPYFLLRHPERYRSKSAEAFERLLENKA